MNAERWQQIEEIFQSALDLASAERAAFIAEQCGADAELKLEVDKLLSDYDSAESFIELPVWTNNQLLDSSAGSDFRNSLDEQIKEHTPDSMLGRQIGAYRLTAEIGRGGMGAVYRAERADGSFRQRVAIKLIKRGMDTDFILRRFRQERQILATLNHPFIAQLLDGGTTADNLPYFVMEYIEGEPLYKYCDQKKLNIRERLKLFRQICEALDFAHQNQIIHRDIKPPNILISGNGTPKLLDFGIAKVLNPELGVDITIDPTATAMRLMTPEYASPEQVCGSSVTPASDIYSLGVLLYELLTGHRPYRFRSRAPHEIARVICEEEPDRPSTGITRRDNLLPTGASEATTLVDVYLFRGAANIEDLRRELSGDIERIILKCLRKEPGERYQTAAELAADITRYLNGKPIVAETYFAAAASLPVKVDNSTKSLAVLPLEILNLTPNVDTGEEFLSVGLADAMITRLSGIRNLAVRPTSAVIRYADAALNPLEAGRDLGVDFVLDGRIKILGVKIRVSLQLLDVKQSTSIWANQFDEKFTDALELEDSISNSVAEAVLPQLTDTKNPQIRKRGTDNSPAFEAYLRGRHYWNQFTPDSLPKALDSFQKAIEFDPNYALAYVGLADFYTWAGIYGIFSTAASLPLSEQAARRALELDDSLGEAYASLGLVNSNLRNWAECERLYIQALKLNPNYPHAHEWYAALLTGTGRFDEGIKEILRAEELDPLSLRTMTLVAWTSYQARLFDEAIEKAWQIIDLDKNYPQGYLQLGNALMEVGQFDEAVSAVRKGVEMMPDSALPKYNLCFALTRVNRPEEARAVLEEIKQMAANNYVKPYFLAMAHAALGERDEALKYFEQAIEEHDGWILWFGTEPKLDSLRDDARFIELFKRTKNPLVEKNSNGKQPVTGSEKSIAVLPFKLIGAAGDADTGDDGYLCVGLADALITRLSNVRRFVVRPTSSVLQYGRTQTDSFTAGRELGVNFVVDGSIRRVGSRIRVTVQLLSVNENATRWAQTFDENFSDVLTLEDTISEQIAKSLLPHLTGEEERQIKKRGTDNPEAFEAYLRGRHHWNSFTEEGFAKSLIFYNQAISIAPDYALAFAGIADYYNFLGVYAVLPFAETCASAREAAQKAIELDANLAEGYAALGCATLMGEFDWTKAEQHMRRAVELNPNYALARVWYSYYLGFCGRFDEALMQINRALEIDRYTPMVPQTLNWVLYHARRYDEAIEATRRFVKDEPRYGLTFLFFGSMLWRVGHFEEAIKICRRAVELLGRTPYTLVWLASAYAADGQTAETQKIIEEIKELSARRYVSPYLLAMVYANLNDTEKTFELLERAWEIRDGRLVWLAADPQFDQFRSDSRFEKLLRLTNNPQTAN